MKKHLTRKLSKALLSLILAAGLTFSPLTQTVTEAAPQTAANSVDKAFITEGTISANPYINGSRWHDYNNIPDNNLIYQTVEAGESTTCKVKATTTGSGELTYKWYEKKAYDAGNRTALSSTEKLKITKKKKVKESYICVISDGDSTLKLTFALYEYSYWFDYVTRTIDGKVDVSKFDTIKFTYPSTHEFALDDSGLPEDVRVKFHWFMIPGGANGSKRIDLGTGTKATVKLTQAKTRVYFTIKEQLRVNGKWYDFGSDLGDTYEITAKKTAHTHSYTSKVKRKATTEKDGLIQKICDCGDVKSTTKIPSIKSVTLSKKSFKYTGKAQRPTAVVKDRTGKTLKAGTDYTISYSKGRIKVGTYTATINFKGRYSGSVKRTFKIVK